MTGALSDLIQSVLWVEVRVPEVREGSQPDWPPRVWFPAASVEPDHAKRYPYARLAEPPNPPAGWVLYMREDSQRVHPFTAPPAPSFFPAV
ncbi:hypothetical protein GSI_12402 [Ganoderma sinense ZZ0214-1]|uniref:Uncharacterized protein n=1 Tax=Ganoderma sinense ZZ0214-1 TaxID=1077348 RepID=A0A2G8RVK7_9APHY|nr:hypothetical protein GSI_12402 [Ganoderma sinense ZZ0214-1]